MSNVIIPQEQASKYLKVMSKNVMCHASHDDQDGKAPNVLVNYHFWQYNSEDYKVSNNFGYKSVYSIDNFLTDKLNEENASKYFFLITDMTVTPEVAIKLDEMHKLHHNVLLVDHHASSEWLNKYEWAFVLPTLPNDFKLQCASSLLAIAFNEIGFEIPQHLVYYAELVRLYDTWDWSKLETYLSAFSDRLNTYFGLVPFDEFGQFVSNYDNYVKTDENPFGYNLVFNERVETIVAQEEQQIKTYIRKKKGNLVVKCDGEYRIGIVYADRYQSIVGNELAKEFSDEADFIAMINMDTGAISFRGIEHTNPKRKTVALDVYSKKHNGGGHPRAAGGSLTPENYDFFVITPWDKKKLLNDLKSLRGQKK